MSWLVALLVMASAAYSLLGTSAAGISPTLVVIAVVGLLASAIAHYVLFEPIRKLVVMAKAVGAGDFSKRLHFTRRDEIGSLAHEMDTLCDQLEAAEHAAEAHLAALDQLRHSDRVATLGRLASSVAHELGNPLNVIELRAQMITSGSIATLSQAQQGSEVILEQTKRMTRIIEEVLSFARMQPATLLCVDLVSVVRKGIALSVHIAKKTQSQLRFEAPTSPLEIDGDADKLLQVVVNLLINGIQATPRGGVLRIVLSEEDRCADDDPTGDARRYACIEVIDHGAGIPKDLLSKVFEPFFSTKSASGGTGLGLSVAQGIAREHEGWISASSEPGRGASFRVYLPKRREANGESDAG